MSTYTPWESLSERGARTDAFTGTTTLGPVRSEPRSTGLTYETYYGLQEKPFSLASDPRFFYHSGAHAPAFDDLLAGIRRRESLNVLTGDIGTGKTTLCRAVLQDLDRQTFSAFVPDPFASRRDLLKVLLMDFGVVSVDDLTSGRLKGASRTELSYLLYEFLDTLRPLQAFAVVIIDEAQNLSVPLLEEIRILSDSDGRDRQLQVVLVGQLELRQKLRLPEMRQLEQRVSVHCNLASLDPDGVAGFIAHRLKVAGGSPDRIAFSSEAVEAVYRLSGGVPRLINRLCDRALHQGYLRRVGTIDREILDAVIPDAGHFAPGVGPAAAPGPGVPDPIHHWLMRLDEGAHGDGVTATPSAAPLEPDLARPDRLTAPPAAATRVAGAKLSPAKPERLVPLAPVSRVSDAATSHPRALPWTKRQKVTRRWTRRIGIAAFCVLALPVGAAFGLSLWNLSTDMWAISAPLLLPAVPPAPPLPAAAALELPPPAADPLGDSSLPKI